jgi:hypothetical protein
MTKGRLGHLIDGGYRPNSPLSMVRPLARGPGREFEPPGRGLFDKSEIQRVSKAMTTATSIVVATVAALLVYSFGRVMRSPLGRWRRRRHGPNTELRPIREQTDTSGV